MHPKMDGFEVCQVMGSFLMSRLSVLTAKGDDMDKILGLEYGADDYITKPFNILEVKDQNQGNHARALHRNAHHRYSHL